MVLPSMESLSDITILKKPKLLRKLPLRIFYNSFTRNKYFSYETLLFYGSSLQMNLLHTLTFLHCHGEVPEMLNFHPRTVVGTIYRSSNTALVDSRSRNKGLEENATVPHKNLASMYSSPFILYEGCDHSSAHT